MRLLYVVTKGSWSVQYSLSTKVYLYEMKGARVDFSVFQGVQALSENYYYMYVLVCMCL